MAIAWRFVLTNAFRANDIDNRARALETTSSQYFIKCAPQTAYNRTLINSKHPSWSGSAFHFIVRRRTHICQRTDKGTQTSFLKRKEVGLNGANKLSYQGKLKQTLRDVGKWARFANARKICGIPPLEIGGAKSAYFRTVFVSSTKLCQMPKNNT